MSTRPSKRRHYHFGFAVLASSLLASAVAQAQPYTPAAEDLELVAPILEGRIDVQPEQIIYVAPPGGPDGDGTLGSPRRDLITVVGEATAGTAIHLAPGVYDMSQIRDDFGHVDSAIFTNESGESGRPIVLRTDPERYDPDNGEIAVLDFNYENDPPNWRGSAFILRNSYWVMERFEMRRMQDRGFWVNSSAHECTFRELELHHANFDGSNNEGLILMGASAGPINNVVIGCHLHHGGNIDTATDELLDRGSVNGGCLYSETRLSYDSVAPADGHDATRAEWEAGILAPDGDVYLIGNEINDCHYGLGLKNMSRGPYVFASNYIHDTDVGVMSPFSLNTVRNNIIHRTGVGINIGRNQTDGPMQTFLKMTGNGHGSEISHNTVIGTGLNFIGGWSSTIHHNLVVDTEEPIRIQRNQFYWWEDAAWPGVRGEFLIGDLDEDHPFYDLVPGYLKETPGEFVRMRLTDNCYSAEPEIAPADFVQAVADITGQTFDEDYVVFSDSERAGLFVDEEAEDFQRMEDEFDCGSRMGLAEDPGGTGTTGGGDDTGGDTGADSQTDGGDGGGGDSTGSGGSNEDDTGYPSATGTDGGGAQNGEDSSGCGCTTGPARNSAGWLLSVVGLFAWRRRRRAR
ncbi:MAG: hypothetical protein JKY37_16965 [Nannocystaceae bacterium]|nr:hypothetical protein [Nannocystaceae bacterium]